MIEKKYINGQKIDSLEIKTLNKIKLIVDLNNRQIFDRGSTGTDRCGCDSFAAGMERKDGIFCRNQ